MTEGKLPGEFLEKLIIKGMMIDPQYTVTVSSSFKKDYFEEDAPGEIFNNIWNYYQEYSKLPPREVLVQQSKHPEKIKDFFQEIDSIDFDVAENYDYLFSETNSYLKDQAIKDVIMRGVDLVDKGDDPNQLRSLVEDALSKDLKIDLGTNYWNTLKERLSRVLSADDIRIPTHYPIFDEFISGGFIPYSLSVILAKIHGGKSNALVNFASRQALNGLNPVIMTLEMSEQVVCQRLDSIHSGLDMNRMYIDKKMSEKMVKSLKEIRNKNNLGNLWVKEFPTGNATIEDFRKYLRELSHRGIKPSCVFVDYINLMKPSYKNREGMYMDIKRISEDLRALSLEFQVPFVSVSQLNREGMFTNLKELDFTYVAESIALSATSDVMAILGNYEDEWIYESEVHYKFVKNRLGMAGGFGKFYVDKRSLKMYDGSELNEWIEDAKKSQDTRKIRKRE